MTEPLPSAKSVLVVFFSRAGENYYYGDRRDLKVGNTEVVAQMIRNNSTVTSTGSRPPTPPTR